MYRTVPCREGSTPGTDIADSTDRACCTTNEICLGNALRNRQTSMKSSLTAVWWCSVLKGLVQNYYDNGNSKWYTRSPLLCVCVYLGGQVPPGAGQQWYDTSLGRRVVHRWGQDSYYRPGAVPPCGLHVGVLLVCPSRTRGTLLE